MIAYLSFVERRRDAVIRSGLRLSTIIDNELSIDVFYMPPIFVLLDPFVFLRITNSWLFIALILCVLSNFRCVAFGMEVFKASRNLITQTDFKLKIITKLIRNNVTNTLNQNILQQT